MPRIQLNPLSAAINEKNSKDFAALLKTNDKFVEYLQGRGFLEKVKKLIDNSFDKLPREIIDQSITSVTFKAHNVTEICEQKSNTQRRSPNSFFYHRNDGQARKTCDVHPQEIPVGVLDIIKYADISKH